MPRCAVASRRKFCRVAMLALSGLAILGMPGLPGVAATAATHPVKIGIIGAGKIGGTLATLWVQAGHEVLISSRHPDKLKALAQSLGPKAHVGTPREAAVFGDVVLISIPYGALPQVGKDLATELAGKIEMCIRDRYPGPRSFSRSEATFSFFELSRRTTSMRSTFPCLLNRTLAASMSMTMMLPP